MCTISQQYRARNHAIVKVKNNYVSMVFILPPQQKDFVAILNVNAAMQKQEDETDSAVLDCLFLMKQGEEVLFCGWKTNET